MGTITTALIKKAQEKHRKGRWWKITTVATPLTETSQQNATMPNAPTWTHTKKFQPGPHSSQVKPVPYETSRAAANPRASHYHPLTGTVRAIQRRRIATTRSAKTPGSPQQPPEMDRREITYSDAHWPTQEGPHEWQKLRQSNRNTRMPISDTAQQQNTPDIHEVRASPTSKPPGEGSTTEDQGRHQQGDPSLATRYQRNATTRPMQEIDIGYTEYGRRNFLIMVDRLSTYIRCQETKDKTTVSTIKTMESWFKLYG